MNRARHHQPSDTYPLSYFDEQMCLKPPLLLWVAVLFLSRALTLPVAMAIVHFAGADPAAIAAVRGLWNPLALLPSLIAAPVLYALCRRVPSAHSAVRSVWERGRILLSIAAALDVVLIAIAQLHQGYFNDQTVLSLCAAVVDLYFLVYIAAARRVRDTFAEFPARSVVEN